MAGDGFHYPDSTGKEVNVAPVWPSSQNVACGNRENQCGTVHLDVNMWVRGQRTMYSTPRGNVVSRADENCHCHYVECLPVAFPVQ